MFKRIKSGWNAWTAFMRTERNILKVSWNKDNLIVLDMSMDMIVCLSLLLLAITTRDHLWWQVVTFVMVVLQYALEKIRDNTGIEG